MNSQLSSQLSDTTVVTIGGASLSHVMPLGVPSKPTEDEQQAAFYKVGKGS